MSNITRRGFLQGALSIGALPLVLNASENNTNLKFIHITDSHMDLNDNDSIKAMELMVDFINKEYKDLDFVLFGGDNFNNNVVGDKDAIKFKEIIDTLHCTTLVVRGNKEANPKPNDGINLNDFKTLFLNHKDINVVGKDWSVLKNGYLILGLDSCIESKNNGKYSQETINFAKNMLEKKYPTLILNHHPYTNYWKSTDKKDIAKYVLGNTKEVQKELFKYPNLILTLSGHKHIDSVTQLQGTKTIVTRGFIRPLDLDMFPMRYVEINNNKISEKLIYTS